MNKNDVVKNIRDHGFGIIEQFLPSNANAELGDVINARRHQVDTKAFLMFMSIRALLHGSGMTRVESDREAGQVMALLKV